MKNSPKNFYNTVDKKKLGIDEAVAVAGEVEQLKTTVGDSSSGLVKQVNDLQTTVDNIDYDISRKADIDGTYPDMTVGNADQLNSTQMITDKVPYVFRTSGGSNDIGNRENDKLVGGTLAFNQLIDKSKYISVTANDYTITPNNDGSLTVEIINTISTDTSVMLTANVSGSYVKIPSNHKFILIDDNQLPNEVKYRDEYNGYNVSANRILIQNSSNNNFLMSLRLLSGLTAQTFTIKPMIIDLTQMFGSTIADYVYSLEQGTPGSGVALFRKLFPKDHYAYNAGQLMSVKATAHEMVGFNAYDHVTGTAKLLGGNEYQITGTYTAISYEDINGNAEIITPDASGIFTPTNNGTMTVTGGNDTDTCIHLTWTGYRNGEFEPYIKRSYILDDDLELRGIPKVEGDGNIYYDGDTYEYDGTVTRRYGIVDLGTLSWSYNSSGNRFNSSGISSLIKAPTSDSTMANILANGFITMNLTALKSSTNDNLIAIGDTGGISVRYTSAGTDATAFKSAMSDVYLVYELATPTIESADPFQDPQWVDDYGTEEYVDTRDIPIPVGHITQYPANLRDKLQHLPSPTGVNGNYIIREDTEVMSLVPAPTGVPELPTVDGTYVLTCTVSDGTATLTWTSNA